MEKERLINELRELIAPILNLQLNDINAEDDFVRDLGMDSLMAYEMLGAIEKKYKILLSEDNFEDLLNLDKIAHMILRLKRKKK